LTVQLDDLDRRILRALQADGRQSHTQVAEQVGSSAASCWRRIRALETAGVLDRAVWLVSRPKIGLGVTVICNLRIRSHESAARAAFETFIRTQGEILECHSMSGEWDYLLKIVVADVSDYERFLMGRLLGHPAVATASSHFALAEVKYTTAVPV
jgi:Lrp/AsnC family transcriptional regulator